MGSQDIFLGPADIPLFLIAGLCIVVGVGLLTGKKWGWMLGLISIITCLAFSVLATVMGIYYSRLGIAGWLTMKANMYTSPSFML